MCDVDLACGCDCLPRRCHRKACGSCCCRNRRCGSCVCGRKPDNSSGPACRSGCRPGLKKKISREDPELKSYRNTKTIEYSRKQRPLLREGQKKKSNRNAKKQTNDRSFDEDDNGRDHHRSEDNDQRGVANGKKGKHFESKRKGGTRAAGKRHQNKASDDAFSRHGSRHDEDDYGSHHDYQRHDNHDHDDDHDDQSEIEDWKSAELRKNDDDDNEDDPKFRRHYSSVELFKPKKRTPKRVVILGPADEKMDAFDEDNQQLVETADEESYPTASQQYNEFHGHKTNTSSHRVSTKIQQVMGKMKMGRRHRPVSVMEVEDKDKKRRLNQIDAQSNIEKRRQGRIVESNEEQATQDDQTRKIDENERGVKNEREKEVLNEQKQESNGKNVKNQAEMGQVQSNMQQTNSKETNIAIIEGQKNKKHEEISTELTVMHTETKERKTISQGKGRNESLSLTWQVNVAAKTLPYLIVVGGLDLENIGGDVPGKCIFALNLESPTEWIELNVKLDRYTHHFGCLMIERQLHVIGGAVYDVANPSKLGEATDSALQCDLPLTLWMNMKNLPGPRSYHATCTWKKDCIIVICGESGDRTKIDSIEMFEGSQWRSLTQHPSGPMTGMSATVLGDDLYIVGGYKEANDVSQILSDVQVFNLKKNTWQAKRNLPSPRCHASLVLCKNNLYLVGGRTTVDGVNVVSVASILRYTVSKDEWQDIAQMALPRNDAACAVADASIYIIGGLQNSSPKCLRTVEVFETTKGTSNVKSIIDLPYPVMGAGACIFK